jgi:hypothetical protein
MRLFGKKREEKPAAGISKTRLLLGAAGLLLFIVGVKRSYRLDDQAGSEPRDGAAAPAPVLPGAAPEQESGGAGEREARVAPPS